MNREAWLTEVAKRAEPLFHLRLLPYRVTCGWPCKGGVNLRRRVVGECFDVEVSSGGVHELFISPVLDKPLEVAGTLMHEMTHVAAGVKSQHGKEFVKWCNRVGLTDGKPRSVMPGQALNEKLSRIIEAVGDYPHKALVLKPKPVRRSANAPRKVQCECGCTATIPAKWLDAVGPPTCGCGRPMIDAAAVPEE